MGQTLQPPNEPHAEIFLIGGERSPLLKLRGEMRSPSDGFSLAAQVES